MDGAEDDDDAATAAAAAAADDVSSTDGVGVSEPLSGGIAASFWPSGGFQRDHFLASAESSRTSTISLTFRSQRLDRERKVDRNGNGLTQRPLPRIGVVSQF